MADAQDALDCETRESLARRIGRPVDGVASVRPSVRDGWISWASMGVDDSLEPILTAAVAFTATISARERRRARATGLATRMVLVVTEHEAHLFRSRAAGRIIREHVVVVPYGMVNKVTVGRKESDRIVASFVKVTIEITGGSMIELDGDAEHRSVFEELQARAAEVPIGTAAPAPTLRPEAGAVRVLASTAGQVANGTVRLGRQVRAARNASK